MLLHSITGDQGDLKKPGAGVLENGPFIIFDWVLFKKCIEH